MAITQTSSTTPTQDGLALLGRIFLAALFIPAGFGKIGGFAGTVGYIGSVGLPLPQVGAVIAILVELGLGILLLLEQVFQGGVLLGGVLQGGLALGGGQGTLGVDGGDDRCPQGPAGGEQLDREHLGGVGLLVEHVVDIL